MAGKQFKTYCKIIDYVDAVDPEFATIARGVCSDLPMGSLRGKPGITLLLPKDKAFRAKLEKLAYSDKTEEANQAGELINALIIRDIMRTPSDWKSREVSNSLFPAQAVEVASTTATEVVFKSGARAVLDTKFKDASRRGNLAIWTLTAGNIPVTTDKPAKKLTMGKPGAKTGGYAVDNHAARSDRFKIALAVENEYAIHRVQADIGGPVRRDVYMEYTMSLINHIMNVRKDTALLYDKVLPLLSCDKLDFYLLVEPHKEGGSYLLDDDLIREWWTQRTPCITRDVIAAVQQLLNSGEGARVYTDRAGLMESIAPLRTRVSQFADSRPRGVAEEIHKMYAELESTNMIGGGANVYPQGLAAYYKANPGLKLIQDELRFLTFGAFTRLENNKFDYGAFHELTNGIGECLHANSLEARASAQRLINKNSVRYLISPSEIINEINIFANSTMFLYIPLLGEESENLKQKSSIARPNPDNIVIYNIAAANYARHNRILWDNNGIIDALKTLDLNNIDPLLMQALQAKFSA